MARSRRVLLLEDEKYVAGFNTHYLLRALSYIKPYKKLVIISLIAMIINMLCGLASPYLIGQTLDQCVTGGNYALLPWIVAALACSSAFADWSIAR